METVQKTVMSYRDLIVWQKGIELAKLIYQLTERFPKQEQYGLCQQLRRAAVSVPSNIAEGQTRQFRKEFVQFIYIALGSLSEIDTQMSIAGELGFIGAEEIKAVNEKILKLRKMLYSLLKHLPLSSTSSSPK